jgi:hypothetical protein
MRLPKEEPAVPACGGSDLWSQWKELNKQVEVMVVGFGDGLGNNYSLYCAIPAHSGWQQAG